MSPRSVLSPRPVLSGLVPGPIRRPAALLVVLVAVATLTACADGGSDAGPAPGVDAARAAREDGAVVLDVRTPAEFDSGHVRDAVLLDVQSPGFDVAVAELPDDRTYVVYCRSGNRSAVAAERMRDSGLTVLDGGGLGDMRDAGWPVA